MHCKEAQKVYCLNLKWGEEKVKDATIAQEENHQKHTDGSNKNSMVKLHRIWKYKQKHLIKKINIAGIEYQIFVKQRSITKYYWI